MSHFTMLVPASDEKHLDSVMLPYHEYECTGIEDYTEWVDETDKYIEEYNEESTEFVSLTGGVLVSKYDDRFYTGRKFSLPNSAELVTMTMAEADITTFEEFVKDWFGGHEIPEKPGRYGRYTNPNAKWDRWLVGGRWDGILKLKDGRDGQFGEPGWRGGLHRGELNHASTALACDVDWDGMRQDRLDRTMEKYHSFHKVLDEIDEVTLEKKVTESSSYDEDGSRDDNTRSAFRCKTDYARAGLAEKRINHWGTLQDLADLYYLTEEQYKDQFRHSALTFGFIDMEGRWNERGNMGWWRVVNEEEGTPDYDEAFWVFVNSLPHDQRVYVIDCHI